MTPVKKIYFASAVFGIIGLLVICLFLYPLFKQIKDNSQTFLLEKEKIVSLAEETGSLKEMEAFYKTYKPDLERVENIVINPEEPLELIKFLEETATSCNVQIDISSMTKKAEIGDPWPSLYINLLINGSFPNFLEFLEKIENGQYLIDVLNLNIKNLTVDKESVKEFPEFTPTNIGVSMLIKVFTK